MKHSYRGLGTSAVVAALLISFSSGRGQAPTEEGVRAPKKDGTSYSTNENEALTVAAPGVLRNELALTLSNPVAVGQDRQPVRTFGGASIGNTLTDGFAYDPLNPTAALPALNYSARNSFVANGPAGGAIVITYDIAGTTLTEGSVIVFDLYGRNEAKCFDRDDDFDVEFLSGGVVVGKTVSGVIIQAAQYPPSPEHVRVSTLDASVEAGATIDRIRIIARDSNGHDDPNYFTLQEVRAAFLQPVGSAVVRYEPTSAEGAEVKVNADGSFSFDPTGVAKLQALSMGESIDDTFTCVVVGAVPLVERIGTVTVTVNGRGRSEVLDAAFLTNEDTALSGVLRNFRKLALKNPTAVRLSDGKAVKTYRGTTTIGNTLTDEFAYNPQNPIVPTPEMDYSAASSFHAWESTKETIVITYDIDGGAAIAEGGGVVIDLYGRGDYAKGFAYDNGFDVEFLSGGSVVGRAVAGLEIPDVAPQHLRVSAADASVEAGSSIDQLRITARHNRFALQEIRAAVLEPVIGVIAFDALSVKGAVVTVNADGSFAYDPTGSATLRSVGEGGSIVDTFTYVIGGTAPLVDRTATVAVTVNGVPDLSSSSAIEGHRAITQK